MNKFILSIFIMLLFFTARAQNENITSKVIACEYWIDGNYKNKIIVPMDSNQIIFSVDASMLKEGLHTLNYRIKNSLDSYSSIHTWLFLKTKPKATKISWCKYWWNNHQDKAIKEYTNCNSEEFLFEKTLTIPNYAITDGYSSESTARLHIVFGDNVGGVSNVEWVDVAYPDVIPPVSTIETDKEETNQSVTLKWHVINDQVQDYNIYYSENDQPFILWLPNTKKETVTFKGQSGRFYRFTVTARDKAGNREQFDESKYVKVRFISN